MSATLHERSDRAGARQLEVALTRSRPDEDCTAGVTRRKVWRDRLLLTVVTLPLLLCGFHWGLPCAVNTDTTNPWGYDEVAPMQPLIEAHGLFTRSRSYLAYPLFHYMVLTGANAPYLGYQYLTGSLRPAASYPYGMSDPVATLRALTIIDRAVSVLMALGGVWIIFALGQLLFDRRTAWWAAILTALVPLFVFYGKLSNLDVPYMFWTLLAVLYVAKILSAPTARVSHHVLLGVVAALATATKDQALGYLVLYPWLLVIVAWRRAAPDGTRLTLWRAVFNRPHLYGLAAAVVTFTLANNLIFGGRGFLRHLEVAAEMSALERRYGFDFVGQIQLLGETVQQLAWVIGPLLVLAVVGIVCLARVGRWGVIGLLLLPVIGHQVLVLGRIGYVYPRFVLPAVVLLILAGVAALHHLTGPVARLGVRLLALAGALYVGVLSANLDCLLVNDARCQAEAWVADHVSKGSTFESYTWHPCVLLRVWDRQQLALVPAVEMTAEGLQARFPDYVVVTNLVEGGLWNRPETGSYLRNLFAERYGYRIVADFATPAFLPSQLGRLINSTSPRVTLFRREETQARHVELDSRRESAAGNLD